jgi:hypothetical protein
MAIDRISMKPRISNIIEGHRLLFGFLFRDGRSLLGEVAAAWDKPRMVDAPGHTAGTRGMAYAVRREVVDGYNQRYEELKLRLRTLVRTRGHFGRAYLVPLFTIRLLTVIATALFGFLGAFLVSATQFLVAPYSFFAAFAAWLGMVPYYVIHFSVFAVLQLGTWVVYSRFPVVASYMRVPITPALIIGWIVVDQLICVLFCFWTPIGKPIRQTPKRLMQSIGYGFLNSKTYWLVLLIALRGFHIDILALVIAAFIPFRMKAKPAAVLNPVLPGGFLHRTFTGAMFYHYHRMVHLPGPYNEGHRHHHYLLDSTPFDAHMHGTGMPEEWFKLMTEISICSLTGLMPWSFAFSSIQQSLINKIGHARIDEAHPVGDNFHVNHHARHSKNFGFAALPLDLLLGSEHGDVSRLENVGKPDVRCTRHTQGSHYLLVIAPAEPEPEPQAHVQAVREHYRGSAASLNDRNAGEWPAATPTLKNNLTYQSAVPDREKGF